MQAVFGIYYFIIPWLVCWRKEKKVAQYAAISIVRFDQLRSFILNDDYLMMMSQSASSFGWLSMYLAPLYGAACHLQDKMPFVHHPRFRDFIRFSFFNFRLFLYIMIHGFDQSLFAVLYFLHHNHGSSE